MGQLDPDRFYLTLHNMRMSKPSRINSFIHSFIHSFIQAARDGEIEIVRQHIQALVKDRKKLNRKDQENSTALHYAVRYGHFNIVKLLVESGASQ